MPRVVHFEIPASDVARAVEFYRTVFGWEISTWGGPMEYFLADTGKEGPGINGAIMGNGGTAKTTVNTIGVASLDESVEKIIAAGGARVTENNLIPDVGYFCYCKDTEGNLFGVLEPLPGNMQSR
jgi:predicted enzyme related to lactoylglutathione lyase